MESFKGVYISLVKDGNADLDLYISVNHSISVPGVFVFCVRYDGVG